MEWSTGPIPHLTRIADRRECDPLRYVVAGGMRLAHLLSPNNLKHGLKAATPTTTSRATEYSAAINMNYKSANNQSN
jgi:hypothetical protein